MNEINGYVSICLYLRTGNLCLILKLQKGVLLNILCLETAKKLSLNLTQQFEDADVIKMEDVDFAHTCPRVSL